MTTEVSWADCGRSKDPVDVAIIGPAAIFASFTVTWLLRSRMIFVESPGR